MPINTASLVKGLQGMQLQAKAVSITDNKLKTDQALLSKAHRLINQNKTAAEEVLAYCEHQNIDVPDVVERDFLCWYSAREKFTQENNCL